MKTDTVCVCQWVSSGWLRQMTEYAPCVAVLITNLFLHLSVGKCFKERTPLVGLRVTPYGNLDNRQWSLTAHSTTLYVFTAYINPCTGKPSTILQHFKSWIIMCQAPDTVQLTLSAVKLCRLEINNTSLTLMITIHNILLPINVTN